MIIDEEEYLEHYGVKGMKWGVRRNRRAESLARVGRGEGTKGEKLKALGSVSVVDLVAGKGIKGAAKRRSDAQLERNKRVQSGKANIRDKMSYYGGTRIQDLAPSKTTTSSSKARKPGLSKGEKAIVGVTGAAFLANAGFAVAAAKMGR